MSYYILEQYNDEIGAAKWFVKKKIDGTAVWTSNFTEAKTFRDIDKVCSYCKKHFELFPKHQLILARRCTKGRPIEGYSVFDRLRKNGWEVPKQENSNPYYLYLLIYYIFLMIVYVIFKR